MNRLLRTQLRRYFGTAELEGSNIADFLAAVDAAYDESDLHANRMVHSLSVMCEELEHRNSELRARNARLEHLNQIVVELARARYESHTPYARITETCGMAFGAARTSVWRVEADRMSCLDLYELADGRHSHGLELLAAAYPVYFAAIRSERAIAAHDARTDPRTYEFRDHYLVPLGITSMLDAAAFSDNEVRAVLCIEHTGEQRRWTAEEIAFAGSIADLVAVVFESHRRREMQSLLDHQRSFLRQVIDLIPNLIFAKDRDGRFTLVNDATATFYGATVADLLGKRDVDFNQDSDQVAQFRYVDTEVLRTLREHVVEAEPATNAAGEVRWLQTIKRPIVEPDGHADMLLGVATDITNARRASEEREKLQATLRQAQKLESLGLLAGGIAHDLNNILTPVLMTSSMLLEDIPEGLPMHEDVSNIMSAAESARELTGQLLAFGRKQVLSLATTDLNNVIRKSLRMIARLVPTNVRLVTNLSADVALVRADTTQISQAIVNLVVNACDAMPEGGTIVIATEMRDEHTVTMTVQDTGIGMDERTIAQIFDPFFTTKELGRGTGLGLATVHGIVEQHQGSITVESTVGQGTRFTIVLPKRDRITAPVAITNPIIPITSTSTILVVEDESPIRRLVQRVLAAEGYTILSAEHAEQALDVVRSHPGPIDLLLTDVVLPGMSGPTLYDQLRGQVVERVIFMSGHARDALNGPTLPVGSSFLRKPFTTHDLRSVIQAVLG